MSKPKARCPACDCSNLTKGWMPEGVTVNDLDDGDFAWLSTAYVDGKESASLGRKLPYKFHGEVSASGWRAAWSSAHGARRAMGFSGGPSNEDVIALLLQDKPENIQVSTTAVPVAKCAACVCSFLTLAEQVSTMFRDSMKLS